MGRLRKIVPKLVEYEIHTTAIQQNKKKNATSKVQKRY
jgi:hypothetical protein